MKILSFKHFESSKDKFPNIKTVNVDDFTVLIGKDAVSNDHLSINKNMTSRKTLSMKPQIIIISHIRVNDKLPTLETIKKVAHLAAKNSKAKDIVNVVYCKSKFVKKSSDMKPGQVSVDYINSEEIQIEI